MASSLKGEAHPRHKLTNADVREARKLHRDHDMTFTYLARIFAVNASTISRAVRRRNWSHI